MTPMVAEIAAVLTAVGAVAGSFTATAVVRCLRDQQALQGRSSCDCCGTPLSYGQTVPVVSYLVQRGVCSGCRARIDPMHLWGEAAGALIGLCVGATVLVGGVRPLAAAALAALGYSLLALSLVDLRVQRIPDRLTSIVLLACAALALGAGALDHLLTNLIWAAGCFAALTLVRAVFRAFSGEDGLGFGDVKLLSVLAVWLGPLAPYALIGACLLALLVRVARRDLVGRAPFGPWIALAAWIVGLAVEVSPWPA